MEKFHSFQLFYFTNYTRNKHNLNHESYISSIYVHLSWDSIHPPHRCFGQNGRSARPVDPVQDQRWWSRSLQVSDGKTCDLVCQLNPYSSQSCKIIGFLYSLFERPVADGCACGCQPAKSAWSPHDHTPHSTAENNVNNPWHFITFFPQRKEGKLIFG